MAKTTADSVKLRLYLYNIQPGYYKFTSLYSLDSLDKSTGRRYRIYFEREDSTRREVSEGSLMRRAETEIRQNHQLIDTEDDIRRLVIDFYHFDDDVEKKKRTVPKITIHDVRVEYTPPQEYCMKRLLDEQTKQDRMDILMRMQMDINEELNKEKIGSVVDVLCEDYDPVARVHFGRSAADAPEIDGKVYFKSDKRIAPGSFVKVKVREVLDYDLVGRAITKNV